MPLTIQVNDAPGTTTVTIGGSLDSATAPQLDKALAPLLDRKGLVLLFDMAALDFISSAGLRVFMAARKKLTEKQGKLLMKNLRPHVQKVFDIVKSLPGVQIFSSVQELDAYLAKIQQQTKAGGAT